jgi:hypothetical protein
LKTKNVTHLKLETGERTEIYIRSAIGGKMQMFCSGPGTISIVRYQVTERNDSEKK